MFCYIINITANGKLLSILVVYVSFLKKYSADGHKYDSTCWCYSEVQ